MENWKAAAIILMVGAMGGYGAFQARQNSGPNANNTVTATPTPGTPQKDFLKKPLPAWDFPISQWTNTTKPISLADLKGHVTLLEVFRIDCVHCQEAAPFMAEIFGTYGSRGLKMVSIQSPTGGPEASDWPTVKSRVESWGVEYPVAFDKDGTYFKKKLGGKLYPSVYVLDKNGIVRYQKTGHTKQTAESLKAILEKFMGKPH